MASKTDSTRVMWRVQTKAKNGNWVNRGLFETRDVARDEARYLRLGSVLTGAGLGFGRTRVIHHVRGGGR